MQDKNTTDVRKILKAVADNLKVKGIRGLAAFLGLKENTIYAWIKRGKIGDTGVILDKCPNIRLGWLETGEGEMFENKFKQYSSSIKARDLERQERLDSESQQDQIYTQSDLAILAMLKRDPEKYLAVKDLIRLNNEEVRETRAEMWQKLKKKKEGP